jgi:hypothetical protein
MIVFDAKLPLCEFRTAFGQPRGRGLHKAARHFRTVIGASAGFPA